jgi:hypothetical protein
MDGELLTRPRTRSVSKSRSTCCESSVEPLVAFNMRYQCLRRAYGSTLQLPMANDPSPADPCQGLHANRPPEARARLLAGQEDAATFTEPRLSEQ